MCQQYKAMASAPNMAAWWRQLMHRVYYNFILLISNLAFVWKNLSKFGNSPRVNPMSPPLMEAQRGQFRVPGQDGEADEGWVEEGDGDPRHHGHGEAGQDQALAHHQHPTEEGVGHQTHQACVEGHQRVAGQERPPGNTVKVHLKNVSNLCSSIFMYL